MNFHKKRLNRIFNESFRCLNQDFVPLDQAATCNVDKVNKNVNRFKKNLQYLKCPLEGGSESVRIPNGSHVKLLIFTIE